jgi:hypothetical protein
VGIRLGAEEEFMKSEDVGVITLFRVTVLSLRDPELPPQEYIVATSIAEEAASLVKEQFDANSQVEVIVEPIFTRDCKVYALEEFMRLLCRQRQGKEDALYRYRQ